MSEGRWVWVQEHKESVSVCAGVLLLLLLFASLTILFTFFNPFGTVEAEPPVIIVQVPRDLEDREDTKEQAREPSAGRPGGGQGGDALEREERAAEGPPADDVRTRRE